MTNGSSSVWPNRSQMGPIITVGQFLRRGWIFITVGIITGAVLGIVALQTLPQTYRARAEVLVRPVGALSTTGDRLVSDISVDTEAQLIKSIVIATAAAKTLDPGQSPTDLIDAVSVEVPPNTTVLSIYFSASNPKAAASGAQAFADAYLQHREQSAQQAVGGQLFKLDRQLTALNTKLKQLTRRIESLPKDSPTRRFRQAQLKVVRDSYINLQTQSTALGSTRIAPGEIISPAGLPESAAFPDPLVVMATACSLGLFAGLCAAWLTRFRYYRLTGGDDVEAMTGRPLLASISSGRHGVWTMTRSQLLMIQGALHTEGRRAVALCPVTRDIPVISLGMSIAGALAHDDGRVAVAMDQEHMSDPAVSKLVDTTHVSVIGLGKDGSGLEPHSPAPGGIVLVLGPPLIEEEPPVLPTECDAAIIVARSNRTTARQAQQAISLVERVGIPVAGTVTLAPTPDYNNSHRH